MKMFASSDLHLDHNNILGYQRGVDFPDIKTMNNALRDNWNSIVGPDDIVFIVGDVVMGPRAESLPLLNEFNGKKHLIVGNHDHPHPHNKESVRTKWGSIYAEYFATMHVSLAMEIDGNKVLFNHFPATLDHTDEVRFSKYRPVPDGRTIIHGHLHCKEIVVEPNHVHVGIDADYTEYGIDRYHPIPLEVVGQVIEDSKNGKFN